MKKIGVLALQGGFAKHMACLVALNAKAYEIRDESQLMNCDALIIPGGESTALTRLLQYSNLYNAILQFAETKPIFGTCAGLILMAKEILPSTEKVLSLKFLDISVVRNAYGRQVDSFETKLTLNIEHQTTADASKGDISLSIPAVFIRAPQIEKVGSKVRILANYQGKPVAVQQGKHLGLSFHPELTEDLTLHRYFLDSI